MIRLTVTLAVFAMCLAALPHAANAYNTGYGNSAVGFSNAVTNGLVRTLRRDVQRCQRLPWQYRYDCYRIAYQKSVSRLADAPAYAEAREILLDVERALAETVAENLDTAAPQRRRAGQTFRAVKQTARDAANTAFANALEDAETKLLRSSGGGNEHFVRIAEALNSNKLLLRSAWLNLRRVATSFA